MSGVLSVCRNVSALTKPAQNACRLFMQRCGERGLNVLITETYRSRERQNYLYEQGRSRLGKIVTWTKNSRHTSRRAWDICKNVRGEEYSDSEFFKECGKVAAELGITWGGNWKQTDMPHFEIGTDWKEKEEDITEYVLEALDKLGDRVTKLENPMIYDYVDENMPSWARESVSKLISKGILKGDAEGRLGLSYDNLRMLTILDRGNAFE